jgi:hypothetical protein
MLGILSVISFSAMEYNEMELPNKIKYLFLLSLLVFLSGCAALDLKPWSSEDIIDGIITTAITEDRTSYGNKSSCNHYNMTCGAGYREWTLDGKTACSCSE